MSQFERLTAVTRQISTHGIEFAYTSSSRPHAKSSASMLGSETCPLKKNQLYNSRLNTRGGPNASLRPNQCRLLSGKIQTSRKTPKALHLYSKSITDCTKDSQMLHQAKLKIPSRKQGSRAHIPHLAHLCERLVKSKHQPHCHGTLLRPLKACQMLGVDKALQTRCRCLNLENTWAKQPFERCTFCSNRGSQTRQQTDNDRAYKQHRHIRCKTHRQRPKFDHRKREIPHQSQRHF